MSKNAKRIKVALVHDYLKEYGGAERVLEALHEIWPEAPIYTTVFLPEYFGPHKKRIKSWKVKTSFLQKIPFKEKLISPFRILAPLAFENFDFSDFDVVIVSATGAYSPNLIITKPETLHFCYCHTPPRYLYGYPTAREWRKYWWGRVLGETINHFIRPIDYSAAQRADYFIANSKNTARRIKKFYRKETIVIYPPVDIPIGKTRPYSPGAKPYYLAGGRLARARRVDLAIKACNELKLLLKVFGRAFAGYGEELKEIAGPTVEFLGEVTEEKKAKLMRGCQAFIFCNLEEDFGIMPVEVQGCGRPVISLRQGGLIESVVEGKTGEFFDEPTVESLVEVLKKFKPGKYKPSDCINQAKKFSKERFKQEIKKFIKEKYAGIA